MGMKPAIALFAAALAAAPAAAQNNLMKDMGAMMDLFDSGRTAMPRLTPPHKGSVRLGAPTDPERWATDEAPVRAKPEEAQDVLADLEACLVADAVFIRQPSLEEAAQSLAPCLEAVSKRYGAAAQVSIEEGRLVIRVPASAAQGALTRDLAKSLKRRQGRLMGWPVDFRADLASVQPKGVSVLQPLLERCSGAKMLPADASGFVAVYGDCLKSAKGLSISEVRAHPSDPKAVVVYSGARLETLLDMSGSVRVPAPPGTGAFRIEARRDLPAPARP